MQKQKRIVNRQQAGPLHALRAAPSTPAAALASVARFASEAVGLAEAPPEASAAALAEPAGEALTLGEPPAAPAAEA
jgi:hypothetical protein